jgi:hypothetical protein
MEDWVEDDTQAVWRAAAGARQKGKVVIVRRWEMGLGTGRGSLGRQTDAEAARCQLAPRNRDQTKPSD